MNEIWKTPTSIKTVKTKRDIFKKKNKKRWKNILTNVPTAVISNNIKLLKKKRFKSLIFLVVKLVLANLLRILIQI